MSQNWYDFKITNIGKETAFGIEIKFENNFIESLDTDAKSSYKRLMADKFSLEAAKSKYLLLGKIEGALDYWRNKCEAVEITGKYCNKYKIKETIYLTEYMHIGMIHNDVFTTEFQYFKKGVIVQNNQYMPIQKSLDMIAKKIDKIIIDDNDTK